MENGNIEVEIMSIKNNALPLILSAEDIKELEEARVSIFGKNGTLTKSLKLMAKADPEVKPRLGKLLNEVKDILENAISEKQQEFNRQTSMSKKITFDVTEPGIPPAIGHLHPLTIVLQDVVNVFKSLGFQAADGPEIETDYYNFEALNIPKDHPSRDTQQTLYLDTGNTKLSPGEIILRTQTSAMQGRVMEKTKPPLRVIVPGKNFRYEQVDASHGFEFWQVEGFMVDTGVKLTDLFGTIDFVLRKLMGEKIKLRFATTNFPFVEPGVDTYMECTVCKGKGCSFCKQSGWSEIMPAGMIHPNVLRAAKYDPNEVNGFAFAIGLSRIVTLRYGMDDLRLLTNPDLRIIEQF
jgi:phenylalanyl-tRNA synthetase alpha chain